MYSLPDSYVILCEGISEVAWIQEFNRYLREHNINLVFHAKDIGSGYACSVAKSLKSEWSKNKKAKFIVFIDIDLSLRTPDEQEKLIKLCDHYKALLLFSYNNFEDFLVLHRQTQDVLSWQNICATHGHLTQPMLSEIYIKLFRQHCFPQYEKGDIPFSLDTEHLKNLFANHKDQKIYFHSDLVQWLIDTYNQHFIF